MAAGTGSSICQANKNFYMAAGMVITLLAGQEVGRLLPRFCICFAVVLTPMCLLRSKIAQRESGPPARPRTVDKSSSGRSMGADKITPLDVHTLRTPAVL